jgi:hypothetical protein
MTEREIRNTIAEVCAELDRRARALIVPSLVGAGLVLGAGGCGDRDKPVDGGAQPAYGVPPKDARIELGPMPLYAPPPPWDGRVERGVIPPYMAPDVAPPGPEYMAPNPDGGASTLYSAPALDLK